MIDFQSTTSEEKKDIFREFLLKALSTANISVKAIAQDCSSRAYYRIYCDSNSFVMMDSSLEKQSLLDFINVQTILVEFGLKPPKIIHASLEDGLLLLEDFGDYSLKSYLENNHDKENVFYESAIDSLIKLHTFGASKKLNDYSEDVMLNGLRRSVINSYLPSIHQPITAEKAGNELQEIFTPLLQGCNSGKKVVVLRDYHAENLMVINNTTLGVIDFQDAMNGSAAYDLLSLLEDARIDVSTDLAFRCINYYLQYSGDNKEEFNYQYTVLSAQRNLRILGLFHKFGHLENKLKYRQCIPRVINYLNFRLNDPILKDLSEWCKKYKILNNDSIIQ